jgi:uncharacterized iron-regulated protein
MGVRFAIVIASLTGSTLLGSPGCKAEGGTVSPAAIAQEAWEPADPDEHGLFDGQGAATTFEAFAASVADIDFVAFGEFHSHAVGSRYELQLLQAMADQERPVALAMEFFEADTQPALDAYLAGEIDEAEFRTKTNRNEAYETSHRPLIEFCKERGIPVIAANAPRDLVKGYRESKAESYAAYLEGLTAEQRALLPEAEGPVDEEFKRRFLEFMGPKRGPSFYPSMALWNDAMAEASANFRTEHPEHRVLLVVGGFHVAAHLGIMSQYRARRPGDDSRVLLMSRQPEGPIAFADDDRGEGDVILKVYVPKS